MAKKTTGRKPAGGQGGDRHKSGKLIRLAQPYHEMLKALADENDRPMSRELYRALDEHFRRHGKTPPAEG